MKGQTSVEFLVLLAFMIIVFNAFLIITHKAIIIENAKYDRESLKNVADHIYQEVYIAHQVKDGYSRVFEIPETINGQKFETRIYDNKEIVLSLENQEHVLFLPFSIMTSNNILTKKNLITKNNDLISITPLG